MKHQDRQMNITIRVVLLVENISELSLTHILRALFVIRMSGHAFIDLTEYGGKVFLFNKHNKSGFRIPPSDIAEKLVNGVE